MKPKSKYGNPYNKKRQSKYNTKFKLNATFEEAIQVIVGKKKPTDDMIVK